MKRPAKNSSAGILPVIVLLTLLPLLLAGCKWPQTTAYHYYDHRGVSVGETMRGPDYQFPSSEGSGVGSHKGKVTWGSSLTKADIDEVNRMRAELAARR